MSLSHSRAGPADFFRPFLWLALFAFLVGFAASLALGLRDLGGPRVPAHALTPISAPESADWNVAKAI